MLFYCVTQISKNINKYNHTLLKKISAPCLHGFDGQNKWKYLRAVPAFKLSLLYIQFPIQKSSTVWE